jgi:hypothetical protein
VTVFLVSVTFVACKADVSEALFGPQEESEGPREVLCFDGYVLSAVDDSFLSSATVSLLSDGLTLREVSTETDGYYQFRCAPRSYSHTFVLRAENDGWTSQEIEEVHYRPEVQRFDFVLEPLGGR